MKYIEICIFPIIAVTLSFPKIVAIGGIVILMCIFLKRTYRKYSQLLTLANMKWYEHIILWISPILIAFYTTNPEKFASLLAQITTKTVLLLLFLWIISYIVVAGCNQKEVNMRESYTPLTYAKLRAERDEFTIWAAAASLFMFVLKEPKHLTQDEPQGIIILIGFYILLLVAIYYRHLSQAIYMQESKK